MEVDGLNTKTIFMGRSQSWE